MTIIYNGFDTIAFALKGAPKPSVLQDLQRYKDKAIEKDTDVLAVLAKGKVKGQVTKTGMKGGYAFNLKVGGVLGHVISLKNNVAQDGWNGFVKIRALALAAYGWKACLKAVYDDLDALGFTMHELSLNRVDYAIDFLNAGLELNPPHFVAHSRVTKKAHKMEMEINSVMRGHAYESVTLGKMPNRQICVYNKRSEVVSKRNGAWFEIWGLDAKDTTQTIHRVEIRAGKAELKKYGLTSIADFEDHIQCIMDNAVHAIRYVTPHESDQNVTRWPIHSLWKQVRLHMKHDFSLPGKSVDITRVKHVIRTQKTDEYGKQIIGNLAGLSVCQNIEPIHMKGSILSHVEEWLSEIEKDDEHPFWKARSRALDRLCFLEG